MDTGRSEAFSDGVFAIAITLLVLEIRVPDDTEHLAHELLLLWPSYLAYVISFLLIGLIWVNHHVMFQHIRAVDRLLLFLNTLLLMDVAFLPFATRVLAQAFRDSAGERAAVLLYGMALVVGGVFFNSEWEYARRGRNLLAEATTPTQARQISRRFLVGPLMYLAGTALGAVVPALGVAVFGFLILFYWLPITSAQRSAPT